ncbi:MAG TPA: S9 family peptidase [Bryobacteraceae bacterium]|jgi:dipeptidyl aminopeptidase/acylaminoacyl peptidase|nr:S9 family peptidase [Bryobacteraceae bacterium]
MRSAAWLVLALLPGSLFAQKLPFDPNGLLKIQRIGDPQISPDGKTVAFSVVTPDVGANKSVHSVWTVPLAGGSPVKLTDNADRPRWSADGKQIFYVASGQIWKMNPDGSGPAQVTNLSTEADGEIVSPDGKYLVVTSNVFPDCGADDACNKKLIDADSQSKVKARLITGLLYRHWTQWQGKTRSHLLSISLENGKAADLTPGNRDVPPFSLGGPDDYAISPDSKEVCYSMNTDEVQAIGTNNDLFVVAIEGGQSHKITSNPGADNSPQYSPDGLYLAYRSQARGGYESDRWRLVVIERATGRLTIPTDAIDRAVNSFTWGPDSKRLFFTVTDRGHQAIQFVNVDGGGARIAVSGNNTLDDMQFTADGKTIVFTRQSGDSPVEICRAASNGGPAVPLTSLNAALLAQYQLTPLEDFWVTGADNAQIQSFVAKPPNFDPAKKYPVIMLIHGGPEGEWGESWSYRWNVQAFAGAGYVVVMPNPHGSSGYGQKFTEDIRLDWGGKPYEDIMAVTDYTAKLPYVDPDRIAAAGASYGGYMINWILGHTNRFKCLVSHDGVFDLREEALSTEELWFPIWEFGGMPWENPEVYDRWSPSHFITEFQTPTLVIHGEQDFRIPYSQGLELFTALQMRKVPSQLLIFPDEGHWVLKPGNSADWYKTVLAWINDWTVKK